MSLNLGLLREKEVADFLGERGWEEVRVWWGRVAGSFYCQGPMGLGSVLWLYLRGRMYCMEKIER